MVTKQQRGMSPEDIEQVKREHMNQSDRLDRIEEKIDKMSEAIISIARAEEKIMTLTSYSKQNAETVQTLLRRLERLEGTVNANAAVVKIINKMFWIVIAAAAASISGLVLMQ
jgi:predicted RNase H-like nuclease (RuvC/YqgF family)